MPGPNNPYGDPYGLNQLKWQQGQQPNSGNPNPQGPPAIPTPASPYIDPYGLGNQVFQPQNNQQFGSTPATIYGGGQLGAPNTGFVAASLNNTMSRQAPQMTAADFSGMGQTQASQLGVLDKMRGYAQGVGPSAAQIGSTMNMGQAAMAGRAGMAGGNMLAARAGLGASMGGMGQAAGAGAQARSAETGEMMGALGKQSLGLANNALGASALGDLQIQQQQALGLGQAQRNYQLGQGTIGTALQEQMDIGKAGMNQYLLNKQKQQFDTNQAVQYAGSAIPFVGGIFAAGGTTAANSAGGANQSSATFDPSNPNATASG